MPPFNPFEEALKESSHRQRRNTMSPDQSSEFAGKVAKAAIQGAAYEAQGDTAATLADLTASIANVTRALGNSDRYATADLSPTSKARLHTLAGTLIEQAESVAARFANITEGLGQLDEAVEAGVEAMKAQRREQSSSVQDSWMNNLRIGED